MKKLLNHISSLKHFTFVIFQMEHPVPSLITYHYVICIPSLGVIATKWLGGRLLQKRGTYEYWTIDELFYIRDFLEVSILYALT